MTVLYPRCCGLDVHKDSVSACALLWDEQGGRQERHKEFATHVRALGHLKAWMAALGITHVGMESTGTYWVPVWRALEGSRFQSVLANPAQVKNMPGRKSDVGDSAWLADLLAHGLIRPSFVPPQPVRQLRDLTRLRVKLVQEYNRVHNRIHKVLEDACLKLDTVASDILGVSGRAMIDGIVAGHEDVTWLADKARSHLRKKRAELKLVLRGRVTPHHRWMLGELMEELRFVEQRIWLVDQQLCEAMKPYDVQIQRLSTIPGVGLLTAWTLIAELGIDMSVFADANHLASWAGLCPGNYCSAGKRLGHRTRKGNRWLRRALCQSARAVMRKDDCFLTAYFYRQAVRKGDKRATVATAHKILLIAYHVLRDGSEYRELGGSYYDRLHPERTRNRLIRRLEQLGLEVETRPASPAPLPTT